MAIARVLVAVAIAPYLVTVTVPARAAEPPKRAADAPPPLGLVYDFVLGGRTNPLGSIADLRVRYRTGLYSSTAAALAQNFVGPVVGLALTPQFLRPTVGIELQPLSILHLYAGYEPVYWLGTLGSLHSYPSAGADYPSGAWSTAPPHTPGEAYAALVHQVVLGATLRLKYKALGLRSLVRGTWQHGDVRGADTVFYDTLFDVLVPSRGWVLFNETDLAWLSGFGLTVGVRHALTHVFYPPEAQAPAPSEPNPNTPISRVGPFIAYTFYERPGARFDAPTVLVMASWYLSHRYRTGEFVDQAIPTIIVGLSFRGWLLDPARKQ